MSRRPILIHLGLVGLLVVCAMGNGRAQVAPQDVAVVELKEAGLKTALFRIREAIDRYYADHKQYPGGLDSLMTTKYLPQIPTDPFTGSARSWRTIRARADRTHPGIDAGIYDVKSSSTMTALNGTKYSDW